MQVQFEVFKKTLDEVYEVVTTVIVNTGGRSYRIEVLRDCYSSQPTYKVRCWHMRNVGEQQGLWMKDDLAWVQQGDPDAALQQALGFLSRRFGGEKDWMRPW
jgi:hypothetical protein